MGGDAYIPSVEEFRQTLDESLRTPDSWIALAGLFWLKEGENRLGSDPGADVFLGEGHAPAQLGLIRMSGDQVDISIEEPFRVKVDGEDANQVNMLPDTSGRPTTVHFGPLTFMLIERAGRYALRLWDNSRSELFTFPGRTWYPIDPAYRLQARFEPDEQARTLQIVTTIGEVADVPSAGRLAFVLAGVELEVHATGDPEAGLSVLFKDLTNGVTTYTSGRYLTTEAVKGNLVELDFNRAYNPPCAFTNYATCPLPPLENHLAVRVEAGEKLPATAHT
jgi:uncharacterized protein (DUF1684 family)